MRWSTRFKATTLTFLSFTLTMKTFPLNVTLVILGLKVRNLSVLRNSNKMSYVLSRGRKNHNFTHQK